LYAEKLQNPVLKRRQTNDFTDEKGIPRCAG
jgi:hypothetical protein